MTIQSIAPEATYALRHAVLWPNQPLAYVQLPEDAAGLHFGAFAEDELLSVISLIYRRKRSAFSQICHYPGAAGSGSGSVLLAHTLAAARAAGAHRLWCDARQGTLGFYQRFGLLPSCPVFYKGDIPYQRLHLALT